jgi:type IX secretion system PorP/SprF family membrane protein
MKKVLLSVGVAMMAIGSVRAQDIHHTQYFASPLTLNPALTGLTRGDVRVAANYRSQWYSVSNHPYTTGVVSFDMATMKGKLNNGDAVGVGLIGTYDRSGVGALQSINVGLSLAYHKALGIEKQHTISLGVQGQLVQKSIDFNQLKFEDQFDPARGYADIPTGEKFQNKDLTYPDFNLGIMYSGRVSQHATAYAGASWYHMTRPVETFLSGSNQIHSRYTAYLGGSFDLNENMVLYASGLYQSQAAATEVMLGAAAGFVLNPGHDPEYQSNTIFYLGAWYRYGDAICPYIGFEWTKMTLGVSYDVNISSFNPATNAQGAYEISLTFNGKINKRDAEPRYNFTCPKF